MDTEPEPNLVALQALSARVDEIADGLAAVIEALPVEVARLVEASLRAMVEAPAPAPAVPSIDQLQAAARAQAADDASATTRRLPIEPTDAQIEAMRAELGPVLLMRLRAEPIGSAFGAAAPQFAELIALGYVDRNSGMRTPLGELVAGN